MKYAIDIYHEDAEYPQAHDQSRTVREALEKVEKTISRDWMFQGKQIRVHIKNLQNKRTKVFIKTANGWLES